MTRNDSIEVLNDTTTIQERMNAVLFGQEGLDTDPEIQWVPGDPLYEQSYDNDWTGYYRELVARCKDCDVDWPEADEPCWVCGKEWPIGIPSFFEFVRRDNIVREMRIPQQPPIILSRQMYERFNRLFRDMGFTMVEAGRRMSVALNQVEGYISYAMEDVETTRDLYESRIREWRFGGDRSVRLILDEGTEPPTPTFFITWGGVTIEIPREYSTDRIIPMPERIMENNIRVPRELINREYPTSQELTQERRRRHI